MLIPDSDVHTLITMKKKATYKKRRTSPRTDSKREGSAICRAKRELGKAETALNRMKRELNTAGKYNKSERRGMPRRR